MTGESPLEPDDVDALCMRNLLGSDDEMTYFKDLDSRFIRVSRGHARRFHVADLTVMIGQSDFDYFTDEHAKEAYEAEQRIIRTGVPVVDLLERETWRDRPPTWVLTNKRALRDDDGVIVGTFGVSRDVTDAIQTKRQLGTVLSTSPDAIMRLDTDCRYVYANPAAEAMIGRPAEDIVGRNDEELDRGVDFVEMWTPTLRRVLTSGAGTRVEHADDSGLRHYDSSIVPELDGDTVTGILVMTRDISDRKRAELALAEQAVRDPLTGLANRMLLLDRIEQSVVRLERAPGTLAVLFLDLDRFKVVNDSLGHGFGDVLLVEVARRLHACARRSDTVARFGGDEFVMLCDRVATPADATVVAERLSRELAVPFVHEGQEIYVTASIGITTTSDPHAVPSELIRDADTAMYQAKERGRGSGRFHFFDPEIRDRAVTRLSVENELRHAIERHELRVHYQPLHVLSSGELHGLEALVRWQHPLRGLLAPAEFIPVAEDSNLIVALGEWVLDEAVRQLAEWNAHRPASHPLTMAVNVSARQLGSRALVQTVAACVARHGIEPRTLCLEITETALLEEAAALPEVFRGLRELGVQIALDDFGTGYSSLSHLRRFPVDVIKIDREFVSGLDHTAGDTAVVAAITAMAHALGMTTVGEGVETVAQLDELRAMGCDDVQGFLLARPMPAEAMSALLAARASGAPAPAAFGVGPH